MIDGHPVSEWNRSHNIYGTFAAENHGSYNPMYQESAETYPGRNTAQYLIAGRPLPASQRQLPNGDELDTTMLRLATDSGVAAYPMVADRYHLYGREDPAGRLQTPSYGRQTPRAAERMLLDHLEPYLHYAPDGPADQVQRRDPGPVRARGALGAGHGLPAALRARGRLAGDVRPVSEHAYFERVSGAVDYGADVGMVAHQTPDALALAVTKPGHVKFAFLPDHDDWLLDPSGGAPAFLPSTALTVSGRSTAVYRRARDGFNGTATVLRTPAGTAGYATLHRHRRVRHLRAGRGRGRAAAAQPRHAGRPRPGR